MWLNRESRVGFIISRRPRRQKEVFRISNKIVRTTNITQSAVIRDSGYTTVLASAVFLP